VTAYFRNLLLATEHTEFDAGAERVALALARHCDLPLGAIVPLVSNPEYEAVAPQLVARIEAEAMFRIAGLQALADEARVALEVRVRRGEEPWQEIVAEAAARRADLLVTRRRGKRGFLANLLVGDMVAKVATHAPCHVLMVPRSGAMWQHGILAAIDTSPTAERVVAVASAVAAQCGLPLTLVHVAHEDELVSANATLVKAVAEAASHGVRASAQIITGKVHEAVIAALPRLGADLLVVGVHGEDAVERAALGSNARKLIALAETPVLVVRP
jgi:nucleotide-binding universal stress UspA family protein